MLQKDRNVSGRRDETGIQIIGEAAKSLSPDFRDQKPEVEWKEIIRMRDKIVHHYFKVDPDVVWETVNYDIPLLAQILDV